MYSTRGHPSHKCPTQVTVIDGGRTRAHTRCPHQQDHDLQREYLGRIGRANVARAEFTRADIGVVLVFDVRIALLSEGDRTITRR